MVLIIHTALLAWGAWQHSASWDEVGHLAAGLSHWESGTFDLYRVNPPLVRMVATLPVVVLRPETEWHRFPSDARWRAEWAFGREFFQANGERSLQYLALARWTCIPFSLLGAWTCFRWARDLYGQAAGMMAATLWCLSPNILGNAQMITPDTASAALGVTSAHLFWRWLNRPDWMRSLRAGAVMGLAELTKTTLVVFFLLWPMLWLFWRWTERER